MSSTSVASTGTPRTHPAPAKLRILDSVNRIFYTEGIRSVGVDRLIADSRVTKATFYKHFGSKDRLILEYLRARHVADVAAVESILVGTTAPRERLTALLTATLDEITAPGFRGCAFVNAAAEFSDVEHPVRRLVREHIEWYSGVVGSILRELGHPLPGNAADDITVARVGALASSYAADPIGAAEAFRRAVESAAAVRAG